MALLEVENLQTHFRTPDGVNRAVDGVSFQVNEGETVLTASAGPSKAGSGTVKSSELLQAPAVLLLSMARTHQR